MHGKTVHSSEKKARTHEKKPAQVEKEPVQAERVEYAGFEFRTAR